MKKPTSQLKITPHRLFPGVQYEKIMALGFAAIQVDEHGTHTEDINLVYELGLVINIDIITH